MSVSNPPVATNSSGQAIQGTSGSSIGNTSADNISTNEFLDLMLTSLQDQDPLDPSSQDPTQYLTELAQMTAVEQETDTSQNTSDSAQTQSVSQAIGLIGNTVTYTDQTTGDPVTGTVNSVQITSSGPTLTVAGVAGINLSTITNVTAESSSGSTATGSTATGSTADSSTDDASAGDSSTESGS
jgi:flagellar basal-body rod modification protein FlgD